MIRQFETPVGNLTLDKLLGKGKSGYSHLVYLDGNAYVLKIMHDEPCAYYTFSDNKVGTEVEAYNKLKSTGIKIPALIYFDLARKYLIKDYINGPTAAEWLIEGRNIIEILPQLFKMSAIACRNGINIDYFPTNFVIADDLLYYVDYEINKYAPEWNLENWGLYYWANSRGLKRYFETGDPLAINIDEESGEPITTPFEEQVSAWIKKYT